MNSYPLWLFLLIVDLSFQSMQRAPLEPNAESSNFLRMQIDELEGISAEHEYKKTHTDYEIYETENYDVEEIDPINTIDAAHTGTKNGGKRKIRENHGVSAKSHSEKVPDNSVEYLLYQDLIGVNSHYLKHVRPVFNHHQAINVEVGMSVMMIEELIERDQIMIMAAAIKMVRNNDLDPVFFCFTCCLRF